MVGVQYNEQGLSRYALQSELNFLSNQRLMSQKIFWFATINQSAADNIFITLSEPLHITQKLSTHVNFSILHSRFNLYFLLFPNVNKYSFRSAFGDITSSKFVNGFCTFPFVSVSFFAVFECAESCLNSVWIMLIKLLRCHNPCSLTLYTGVQLVKRQYSESLLRKIERETVTTREKASFGKAHKKLKEILNIVVIF